MKTMQMLLRITDNLTYDLIECCWIIQIKAHILVKPILNSVLLADWDFNLLEWLPDVEKFFKDGYRISKDYAAPFLFIVGGCFIIYELLIKSKEGNDTGILQRRAIQIGGALIIFAGLIKIIGEV